MTDLARTAEKTRLAGFFDLTVALVAVAVLLALAPAPAVRGAIAAGAYGRLLVPAAAYLLVFFTLGVVWANHHRLLGAADHVTRLGVWLTLHVLFWISLFPAVVGEFAAPEGPRRLVPYAVVLSGMASALLLLRVHAYAAEAGNSAMAALHRSSTYRSLAAALICAGSIPLAIEVPEGAVVCFLLAPALFLLPEPEAS